MLQNNKLTQIKIIEIIKYRTNNKIKKQYKRIKIIKYFHDETNNEKKSNKMMKITINI